MTQPLSIDLGDPRVRRLLHGGGSPSAAPRREVVQVAGDDGWSQTTHLDSGKDEVVVVYRDQFLTIDLYRVPGEPLTAHLICPRCHKCSQISAARKAIDYDPTAPNPLTRRILDTGRPELMRLAQGRLSIEAFECAWEVGGDRHAKGGLHTGVSLCRLRLAIDDNVAKDA